MSEKNKRFYQMPPVEFSPKDIGHKLQIAGMVFQGMNQTVVFLAPDANMPVGVSNIQFYAYNEAGWAALLAASDNPQYYDSIGKAWHRKTRMVVSGAVQQKVWARDDFSCVFCGRRMGEVSLTVDHWIPLELGGVNDTTNYVSACRSCNLKKGDKHPQDFCREIGLSDDDYGVLDQVAKGMLRLS